MHSILVSSLLLATLSLSAHASETITASDWEESKYNVAQVVNHQDIKGLAVSAQLTSVYRGGIAAPFGTYLSVWDPIPQEGGDFGSVKTFDLGNFSNVPKVVAKTLKKLNSKLSVLELTIKTSVPSENMIETKPVTLKIALKIGEEQVENKLTLTR